MRPPIYSKELKIATDIAKKAGAIMIKYWTDDQPLDIKSDNSPVTIADTLINDLVIRELGKAFPADGVIGEEKSTTDYGKGRKWLCDPIDGTAGYIWGTPTAMFSLALVVDGIPVVGVAYDPFLKRMYSGMKGGGSFCNGSKLSVSNKDLDQGFVAVSGSVSLLPGLAHIPLLRKAGARLACFSGAAYKSCLVARGRFLGYIEHGVNPYDMAAVHIIVEEAGGRVTGIKGEALDYSSYFQGVLVSNSKVHEKLLDILKSSKI